MEKRSTVRLFRPYMWSVITLGTAVLLFSAYRVPYERFDLRLVLLFAVTLTITSRISIKIPQFKSEITVSDTFVFLTMLLYGGEVGILLAAAECLCSSQRFSRKVITVLFNTTCIATATFITTWTLRLAFKDLPELLQTDSLTTLIGAMCVMALIQYLANSSIVAIAAAFRSDQSIWATWCKYYLWTSVTYFAGAATAGIIAKLVESAGIYAIIFTSPIIALLYVTYRTYLKNVEAAAAQAEQAERHVAELSHYIAEQERIREQFSQIEKLSALGELASGVAHDFNNTLAGILGRAQLMMRSTDNPEKIKRGLDIIIKSAEDGAKTVKRIQDFARQRRDHDFIMVDVDQLLLDLSEITRPRWNTNAAANNVHIELDLQLGSGAMIMGDDSELREVLVNMVFNAVDAMPEGGKLTLAAKKVDSCVEICVSDTGTGMKPEVRARIFDPFFTTKGKAGLGLGLAVSYGIISRHDGTVEVDSEPGHGATFRIKLPAAQPKDQPQIAPGSALPMTPSVELGTPPQVVSTIPAAMPVSAAAVAATAAVMAPAAAAVAAIAPGPAAPGVKFLVVDDEEKLRELISEILESEGYEVTTADGGHAALAVLEKQNFDAVFTDIGMPGMSGWELARAIRSRDKSIPIAVITGWGEAVGSDEQKNAEVNWVVTKPFTAPRIAELAREVSSQKQVSPVLTAVAA